MGKEYKLKNLYSNMALLLTAFILGLSFVAQKAGMEYIGPFTFNTIRNHDFPIVLKKERL